MVVLGLIRWSPHPYAVAIVVAACVVVILWFWVLVELFRAPKDPD